jgi:RNA polymerase sigma factor (sigma-70 family)
MLDDADAPRHVEWMLTRSAERDLIRRAQSSDANQREQAVKALLKAFRPYLQARIRPLERPGIDVADLDQEACLGFLRAVERFDLTRPEGLATYADLWVRGELRRFASRQRVIHLPQKVGQELAALRALIGELAEIAGREPTLVEIERESGIAQSRIRELLQIPEATIPLNTIENGEAGAGAEGRPGAWAGRAAALVDDVEEDVGSPIYDAAEVEALVDGYQGLRSQLEVSTSQLGEPRLRRRGGRLSNLVRLADLDRALQRASGRHFVALELAGLRDLPLRELEDLLKVRHSTFADRKQAGVRQVCRYLNGPKNGAAATRRVVFWRRLFAWNLGELRVQGEPVAFEIWARVGGAAELWTGTRSIPVRALAAFGEGWLLTPDLLGRKISWDDEVGPAASAASASQ